MPGTSPESKKLQWSWVLISFSMYLFFNVVPVISAIDVFDPPFLLRAWALGGVIIVAAAAGYFSKDVRPPVIASATLVVLFLVVVGFWSEALAPALVFLLLSLVGAWLGARAQIFRRSQSPQ